MGFDEQADEVDEPTPARGAKGPRKAAELAALLASARSIMSDVQGATPWFATQFSSTSFDVFDVLDHENARQSHLAGAVPEALRANTTMLLSKPQIETFHLLARGPRASVGARSPA